ncbi:septum formation protein [Rhodothalassium salexigens DSM 2132]|uniref:Nucleoside triphosphate pyrophosphatase n=1 Tax=Rhodothalassium salexigens DSM 2132 TaxID=1188247 RepID=A0A4R2PMP3_RHOSA|nr:Maf family nucleotide pyrophosphatase [Rhodothalassium salexigens]MBB4211180.1 septum formation protein [Rhodothalassium salexigens DSM 2132]MBK1637521.1 septum formation protein Maf [Rhodothalassium salexigens DSM 2132]TCP36164.1 septum formation protein [Rhodothalassium salexigens DSM 2132]
MALASSKRRVILASASRARREMLAAAGLAVAAVPAGVDEAAVKAAMAGQGAEAVARALAAAKASAVGAAHGDALVIGADQVLSLDDRLYDKPRDRAEARRHLESLSGRRHGLVSAVTVYGDGAVQWSTADRVDLTVRSLTPAFLDAYCAAMGDRLLDSVGGYELEGLGVHLFERIEGDYFTVLGLPLLALLGYLRRVGAVAS